MSELDCIVDKINKVIEGLSDKEWESLVRENYYQFNLMNSLGEWESWISNEHREKILPSNFKKELLLHFVNETQRALIQNTYFMDLLKNIPSDKCQSYSPLVLEGDNSLSSNEQFLKYILSFSFCLDCLNKVGRDHPLFMEELILFYRQQRKANGFYRPSNTLAIIKLHSIELPLVRFLKRRKSGKIEKNFGKYILSLNIFEATLVDFLTGMWRNALATFPMIFFSPHYQGLGVITRFKKGAPSQFSDDKKALLMFSPNPKEWADLYQVWNMAFVSQFDQAPYLLAKLCIPSVSDYVNRPAEYMHTRITALFLAMNYLDSAIQKPRINIDLKKLKKSSPDLTSVWGKINQDSARKYVELITIKKES